MIAKNRRLQGLGQRRTQALVLLLVVAAFGIAFVNNAAAPPAPDAWAVAGVDGTGKSTDTTPAAPAQNSQPLQFSQALPPSGTFQPIQAQSRFVSARPGAAVHAASMVELKDGSLRAVWFSGSREGARDVTVQSAVLPATAGASWSAERTLLTRPWLAKGLLRYIKKIGNPVIARSPDGSLRLYLVTVSLGGWAGSSITTLRSDDEGQSWAKPQRLVTSPFLNISTLVKGAPVAWADGSTALPVYHEFITKMGEVLRLAPDGTVRDKIRIPGSQSSLQPVVLVGNSRDAQVWMRSNTATAVMQSTTRDAGQSWQSTQPGAWPNPDSALAGAVASDGSQWLAINPLPRGRESLLLLQTQVGGDFAPGRPSQPVREIAVEPRLQAQPQSSPAAASTAAAPALLPPQRHTLQLAEVLRSAGVAEADIAAYIASAQRQLCNTASGCRNEYSYPFLLQSRDGAIHLLYTWHRSRIRHVRLSPQDVDMGVAVPGSASLPSLPSASQPVSKP